MIRRFYTFLVGLLLGLLATGLLLLFIKSPPGYPIELLPPPTPGMLSVHISGAVAEPGVYSLPPGSIVQDAVDAAGGLLDEANVDLINLAARLEAGEQFHVPRIQPTEAGVEAQTMNDSTPYNDRININSATAPELVQLPGIGPALAESIIEFREANGPFQSIDDLVNVPGIGEAKLNNLRDLIRLQ